MISFYKADHFENGEDMKFPILKGTLYALFAIVVATSRVLLGVHSLG
jgi:membrane-associated phospholipid phosphatase